MAFAPVGDLRLADVDGIPHDVIDVEKGVASQPDVDEARAHAGEHIFDPALVDGTYYFFFALEIDLRKRTFFKDSDAVLPVVA